MKRKVLYAITTEDVVNVSRTENLPFKEKDLWSIQESIGDYFADKWQDAIEYALEQLKKK